MEVLGLSWEEVEEASAWRALEPKRLGELSTPRAAFAGLTHKDLVSVRLRIIIPAVKGFTSSKRPKSIQNAFSTKIRPFKHACFHHVLPRKDADSYRNGLEASKGT